MAFSPDGKLLATPSLVDQVVIVYDVASGRVVQTFEGPNFWNVKHMAFSPDSRRLAAVSLYASGGSRD